MPAIFGAATTDDITITTVNIHTTATISLVYGWWRPTTLTATRGLWSNGNIIGAEIDATTDELRLRTDNTTDGQWTTAGVDLAVGEWKFIACVRSSLSGTPSAAWRVWAGDITTAPVEATVTNAIAPVGNFVGGASFFLGNKGTASLAFQGEISNAGEIGSSDTAGITTHPFGIAAYGAITNAEAAWIYEQFVLPAWSGDYSFAHINRTSSVEHWHLSCDPLFAAVGEVRNSATVLQPAAVTVNGATYSDTRDPRGAHNLIARSLVRR